MHVNESLILLVHLINQLRDLAVDLKTDSWASIPSAVPAAEAEAAIRLV